MPPQDQAVVHAAGLVEIQGWKIGEGGGLGLVESGLGHRLQGPPARPFEVGRMGDLAEEAAPFNDHAVNVPGAERVGNPDLLGERVVASECQFLPIMPARC